MVEGTTDGPNAVEEVVVEEVVEEVEVVEEPEPEPEEDKVGGENPTDATLMGNGTELFTCCIACSCD